MADGLLSRWSQRKTAARQGVSPPEPPPPPPAAQAQAPLPDVVQTPIQAEPEPDTAPALTLADVEALTPASDFSPFVGRTVEPQVRNAAMKKLFADPHYNVMDRLDIYIDDYTAPDPLPASMLRQMVSAQFLKLVQDEPAPPVDSATADPAAEPPPKPDTPPPNDHPDL